MLSEHELNEALKRANPADLDAVEALRLQRAKRDLFAGIVTEPEESGGNAPVPPPRRRRLRLGPSRLVLGGAFGAAAAIVVILGLALGSAGSPSPAYGAALVRLAKFSPHILLGLPGWKKAEAAYQVDGRLGSIHFHEGGKRPVSLLGGRIRVFVVPSAELQWSSGSSPARSTRRWRSVGAAPVLGTQARIYASRRSGRLGREYVAEWAQSGRHLAFRSETSSRGVFERRLGALRLVGRDAWLAALPGRLIKAGGLIASEAWGEPPVSAVTVNRCEDPLPASILASAPPSRLRTYEHFCGYPPGSPPAAAPSGKQVRIPAPNNPTSAEKATHQGMAFETLCDYPSEAASLHADSAMNRRLEAEGKCHSFWIPEYPEH
jgi:hypothetical protein